MRLTFAVDSTVAPGAGVGGDVPTLVMASTVYGDSTTTTSPYEAGAATEPTGSFTLTFDDTNSYPAVRVRGLFWLTHHHGLVRDVRLFTSPPLCVWSCVIVCASLAGFVWQRHHDGHRRSIRSLHGEGCH